LNPGSVYFDTAFKFHDGATGEKLFVVLGTVGAISVVVKTTSKQHGRGSVYGCQPRDRFPNFFLPHRSCYLDGNSWVCLDEFYELNHKAILQKRFDGLVRPICTLTDKITRELQDCALISQDISPAQSDIIRACLIQP
jgi:hypothetical protein